MTQRKPVITLAMLTISVLVAIASFAGTQPGILEWLLYSNYISPRFVEISQGQLWRLFSPIFIHFGVVHLAMNGVMLWVFGRIMEPVHGPGVFLPVILVTAIVSNTAQYLVSGPLFGGLSGVLYGLLGFIWAIGKLSPAYPIRLDPKFTWFIIGWFVLCWSGVLSIFDIYVANTAHTAGLISGLAMAYLLVKFKRTG